MPADPLPATRPADHVAVIDVSGEAFVSVKDMAAMLERLGLVEGATTLVRWADEVLDGI